MTAKPNTNQVNYFLLQTGQLSDPIRSAEEELMMGSCRIRNDGSYNFVRSDFTLFDPHDSELEKQRKRNMMEGRGNVTDAEACTIFSSTSNLTLYAESYASYREDIFDKNIDAYFTFNNNTYLFDDPNWYMNAGEYDLTIDFTPNQVSFSSDGSVIQSNPLATGAFAADPVFGSVEPNKLPGYDLSGMFGNVAANDPVAQEPVAPKLEMPAVDQPSLATGTFPSQNQLNFG